MWSHNAECPETQNICIVQAENKARKTGHSTSDAEREWRAARDDYKSSAAVFQKARNLSGAIFASSNAALISAQLGNDSLALQVSPASSVVLLHSTVRTCASATIASGFCCVPMWHGHYCMVLES